MRLDPVRSHTEAHKYHGRSGVTKPETATPRQVTQMQADGADGTGGYLGVHGNNGINNHGHFSP